ncbi:IS1634 family transposase [Orrella marina]|uniref:IS1634 family transposase n=1 Tax=Orrella marina TaxID=2163011 RepID=A0A2R4XGU1_9BURK|nr:IS1634 family transposase [Orrella marina]AWB33048.1 IS1634 family transposase [Orrella marina]
MFIKVTKSGTRKYVQLVESYRAEDGSPKQRTVATLGRLDQMDRSLETMLQGLLRATGRQAPEKVSDVIEFESSRAFGDVWALNCLWSELGFDRLGKLVDRDSRTVEHLPLIKAMVFNRLCDPESKLGLLRWLETVTIPGVDEVQVTHQRLLRSMDVLDERSEGVNDMMSELLMRLIDQDLSVVFYDMTTIRTYGLTEGLDDLRAYGMSKESTINRQVMLGVVQTADGIPLAHHVWPGNTAEVQTLQSAVADILKRFPVQRLIVVADRGLLSMETLEQLKALKVKDRPLEFIMAVPGRRYGEFEPILSALHEDAELDLANAKDEVTGETCWQDDRLIWAHSPRVAEQANRARQEKIKAIEDGAARRVDKLDGQDTGKKHRGRKLSDSGAKAWMYNEVKEARLGKIIKVDLQSDLFSYQIDEKALKLAELNDGKLLLVTNVTDLTPPEVVARYKALADIERGFRVLKDEIEIGPIYHRLPKRIRAHATICFIALILHRIIRQRLKAAGSPLSPRRALQMLSAIQKHTVHLGANTTTSGLSNISAEQSSVYTALKTGRPTARHVQSTLL